LKCLTARDGRESVCGMPLLPALMQSVPMFSHSNSLYYDVTYSPFSYTIPIPMTPFPFLPIFIPSCMQCRDICDTKHYKIKIRTYTAKMRQVMQKICCSRKQVNITTQLMQGCVERSVWTDRKAMLFRLLPLSNSATMQALTGIISHGNLSHSYPGLFPLLFLRLARFLSHSHGIPIPSGNSPRMVSLLIYN